MTIEQFNEIKEALNYVSPEQLRKISSEMCHFFHETVMKMNISDDDKSLIIGLAHNNLRQENMLIEMLEKSDHFKK